MTPKSLNFDLVDNVLDFDKNVLAFIDKLQHNELLQDAQIFGQVVFADDQLVNREALRVKMQYLGLEDKISIFSDG